MLLKTQSQSHRLLRRLREVMGGASLAPPAKLSTVVKIIATDMRADSCSVYLLRAGSMLELAAAYGLNLSALSRSRLTVEKGVIGDVAKNSRPLVLSDLCAHPHFEQEPAISQNQLQSFLGVPLNRGGTVIGVLALQNKIKRVYTNEEVELLQTISMVLAEALVAEELLKPGEILPLGGLGTHMVSLGGISIHPGLACGKAVLHYPKITIKQIVADNVIHEKDRFSEAVQAMRISLKELVSHTSKAINKESRDVLETYQLLAHDQVWLQKIEKLIASGLTAEAALQQMQTDLRLQGSHSKDPFFKERLWDFQDLTHRLIKHLATEGRGVEMPEENGIILVARSLGPAELLDYQKYYLQGLILEEGVHTAHVSIVARSLGLPILSRVQHILSQVDSGDTLILDATKGEVILRPHGQALHLFQERKHRWDTQQEKIKSLETLPVRTLDGIDINLWLNVGVMSDMQKLEGGSVEGVGLYRTEIPFMMESSYPDVQTQEKIYQEVLSQAKGFPVTFRTLDIGGDKILPYFKAPREDNPLLGWRAIRIALDRPMLLRHQLRAILRASENRSNVRIMFPMVSELSEWHRLKEILQKELDFQKKQGRKGPQDLKIGVMVEVPSLVWQIRSVLACVDFLSIGSNDLFQFFYATDRSNPYVADSFHPLSPAFLSLLRFVVQEAHKAQKPLQICGEMSGKPLQALALLGLGFRSLSMPAHALGHIKMMVRSTPLRKVKRFLDTLLHRQDSHLADSLEAYAKEQKIAL